MPINANLLTSPSTAVQFLNVDREAEAVVRSAREPSSPFPKDEDELSNYVRGLLLVIASYALHVVCFTDLSKKVWVMSRHAIADGEAISAQKVFKNHLLTRSINTHREDSEDYYLLPRLQTSFIPRERNSAHLNFFQSYGICRGMCYWFASLYLKTKGQCADPEEQVRAVGKQFERGASPQAAFLHSLKHNHVYDLLKLRVQEDESTIPYTGNTYDQICRKILVRVPGVYGIYTSTHMVLFIKIDDDRQYLFDPNVGCIKITGTDTLKTAMEPYLNHHDPSGEILIDRFRE